MGSGVYMRWKLSTALPVAIGIAATVILYGRLLVPGMAFVDRDVSGMHLPMLSDLVLAMKHGIPSWNPMVHGGQPLLTNPHYATFYPPTWLALILPPYYVIGLLVALHALWGYVGSWKLARHWGCGPPAAALAALAFVGGGAFCSIPSLLNLFLGFAWMPWILRWGDQLLGEESASAWHRAGVKLALALAAQLLAGSPVTPLLSVLALLCLALELLPGQWRRLFRLLPAGALGLLLAAIQLLPSIRHLTDSARSTGLQTDMATVWSTPPIRFIELLWPRLFGDPTRYDSYLYFGFPGSHLGIPLILSIYCGALVLCLAAGLFSGARIPRRRTLMGMLIVGTFLALGRYNPIYMQLILEIPPFSIIRFPEKFILLTTTSLSLLAALSWQSMLSKGHESRIRGIRISAVVAAIALVGTVLLYLTPLVAPSLTMDLLQGVSPDVLDWQEQPGSPGTLPPRVLNMRAGFLAKELFVSGLFWAAALTAFLLHHKRGVSKTVLVTVTLTVLSLDLAYYGWRLNPTVPAQVVLDPPTSLQDLPPSTGRVFSDSILFGPSVIHLPDPAAAIPTVLTRSLERLDPYTANLWGYGYALNPDPDLMLTRWAQHGVDTLTRDSGLWQRGWTEEVYRFLGAWNVGIVVRRRSPEAQVEERQLTGKPPMPAHLMRNPHVLPRYRFVSELAKVPDLAAAVKAVKSKGFELADFDAVVRAAGADRESVKPYESGARILALDERANQVIIDYDSDAEAFIVAAVTADRDWTARVDNSVTPIYITALGQMGIELPAGRHRLVLRHRNPAVAWGGLVSLVSLLGCVALLLPRRMNERD